MANTRDGAKKVASKLIGCTLDEYNKMVSSGHKWCTGCKQWHLITKFGKDSTRLDGLSCSCFDYRKTLYQRKHVKKIRVSKKGSRFSIPRNGDKKQARARVNHLIELGILEKPSSLPCSDCGHTCKGDMRHEYHHESYDVDHQEIVVVLCTSCHTKRHMILKTWGRRHVNE
jgi:hypothetical protein